MTKKESDELLDDLRKDSKINNYVLRGGAALFGIVAMTLLLFIVTASKDIAKIQATLVTSDNVTKLKEDLNREFGAYLTLKAYIQIESNRSLVFLDYVAFVAKMMGIKEEELERGRVKTERNLKNFTLTGTTRGHSASRSKNLTSDLWTR